MNLFVRFAGAALALALIPVSGHAQDPLPAEGKPVPLGDVAREQRAARPPVHAKVITNDDLQKTDFNNGAVTAEAAGETPAKPVTPPDARVSTPKGDDEGKVLKRDEDFRKRFQEQKSAVELLQRELAVLQHEQQIQASDYYRDAGNRLRDPQAFTEEQKKFEEAVAAKQKDIESASQTLDTLKEEGRKAGVPAAVFD
jgi:hypothetical protein